MFLYEWSSNGERTYRMFQNLSAAHLIPDMQGKADT